MKLCLYIQYLPVIQYIVLFNWSVTVHIVFYHTADAWLVSHYAEGKTLWLFCTGEQCIRDTHPHSCVCLLPARTQDRRHSDSYPACWYSAARTVHCLAWSTHPSLWDKTGGDKCPLPVDMATDLTCLDTLTTFEEAGGEAGFVDRAVGHKLHPKLVGAALDVLRLVVATEAAQQGAAVQVAVPHLQVVVGATVMPLNLEESPKGRLECNSYTGHTRHFHLCLF